MVNERRLDLDQSKRSSINRSRQKRSSVRFQSRTNRSRRESNPHLRFRKPLFYPLNYGNNDLERINGLNGDGQDTLATPSDFSRGQLRARLSAACLRVSWRGVFPVNPYGCRG